MDSVFYITDLIGGILNNLSSYHKTKLALVNKQWAAVVHKLCSNEPTDADSQLEQAAYYSYVRASKYHACVIYMRSYVHQATEVWSSYNKMIQDHKQTKTLLAHNYLSRLQHHLRLVLSSGDPNMIELIMSQIGYSLTSMLQFVCLHKYDQSIINHFIGRLEEDRVYPLPAMAIKEGPLYRNFVMPIMYNDVSYVDYRDIL